MPQFPKEVIFLEEIKRVVFSRRRLVALLLLAALCLVNLVRISPRRNTGISQVKTEQFLKAHQGESLEELQTQLDRILESPNCSLSDRMSYGLLRNQVEYLLGFPGRLAEIQAQAEHMSSVSIFAGSPYSQANIRKTAADYRRLEGAEVTLGHDRAVEQVMGASLSDWLLGAYMALVVASFLEERKRGLWTMVCASPAGRLGLPVWRLGAVALGALREGDCAFAEVRRARGRRQVARDLERLTQPRPMEACRYCLRGTAAFTAVACEARTKLRQEGE